jgi:uncharacterized protein YjeT (DUF2065 family)
MSLYYLAGYLWVGGIGLLIAPTFSARLLLSDTDYSAVLLRAFGMFMIGMGFIVVQIIRLNITVLFPVTMSIRIFFCACLLVFYFSSGNPFFLVLFGIEVTGLFLTGASYFSERNRHITE